MAEKIRFEINSNILGLILVPVYFFILALFCLPLIIHNTVIYILILFFFESTLIYLLLHFFYQKIYFFDKYIEVYYPIRKIRQQLSYQEISYFKVIYNTYRSPKSILIKFNKNSIINKISFPYIKYAEIVDFLIHKNVRIEKK